MTRLPASLRHRKAASGPGLPTPTSGRGLASATVDSKTSSLVLVGFPRDPDVGDRRSPWRAGLRVSPVWSCSGGPSDTSALGLPGHWLGGRLRPALCLPLAGPQPPTWLPPLGRHWPSPFLAPASPRPRPHSQRNSVLHSGGSPSGKWMMEVQWGLEPLMSVVPPHPAAAPQLPRGSWAQS